MNMMDTRTVPQLLDTAVRQASNLIRDEFALARAEIAEKMEMMTRGATLIGIGAMLVLPALVMILLAIASLLVEEGGLEAWMANLLTGAAALVLGGILAWVGASRFAAKHLAPRETIEEIRRDRAAVREMAR